MSEFKRQKIMIAVDGDVYGFLAVTPGIHSDEKYVISHIGTGYRMAPKMFGINSTIEDCKKAIKIIVDNIPEADRLFKRMVNGNLSDNERNELKNKIKNTLHIE